MPTTENQKLAQELDKATRLKTYLVSDDPAVEALVEKYLAVIKEARSADRSHDEKYRNQLRILICNLVSVNTKKNQWIFQGRGKPSYKITRYFSGLSKAVFVDGILDTLVSLNLLDQHLGFERLDNTKRATRLRAKGRLKADIKKISPHVITIDSLRETLWVQVTKKSWFDKRLKKKKKIKEKLEYKDNHQTIQMRKNLQCINQALHETAIGLWIKDTDYKELNLKLKKGDKSEFSPNEKYLVRIFNDTGFAFGGRFYHGWWQGIPKEYRPYITINHQAVSELDYKHLHPSLMYAKVGYTELPSGFDSYTLELEGFTHAHRQAVKDAFQCLINTNSEKSAINAIGSKGLAKLFPFGPKKLVEHLLNKHTPIRHLFFNKQLGKELQRVDSVIAEYCILEMLQRHNRVVLPVHDSFIVQQDMIKVLQQIMIDAYEKIAGGIIPIDEKGFSLWNPYEALNDNELHLYKVYEKHASEFLKRFNRDISTPFDAPYVFPEAYEDEDVYVIEF
jgi:hypothetical protein